MKNIGKIFVSAILFVFQVFRIAGLAIAGLFRFAGKIFRPFIKFFYYLLILPVYRVYLILAKRTGLSKNNRKRFYSIILANKRLVHIIIIVFTGFFIYNNFNTGQQDVSAEEVVGKTVLAKLVTDEFVAADALAEDTSPAVIKNNYSFADDRIVARPKSAPYTREAMPSEEDDGNDDNTLATERTVPQRTEAIDYIVQTGDSLGRIARKFGISVNTILWSNGLSGTSYIKPGDKLTILPVSGVLHKVARGENLSLIAKKYDITSEEILTANNLPAESGVKIGQEVLIPGGEPLSSGSIAVKRPTKSGNIASNNSGQNVYRPAKGSSEPVSGAKMNWPTQGHIITQYYSWRHNGLDVANKIGTPIYAADGGTIITAGWSKGGYGNQIVIDHGGGKTTRYAHLSVISVHVGQSVGKGAYIGAMGSTGRSTGPHLHFEVMFNGKRYNPLNYVAY